MSPKKGDRAPRPPEPGRYTIKFASNDAAKGWEELCRQAPSSTRTAYDAIESNPCPTPPTRRHHRLKGDLANESYGAKILMQWQYEVTGGGRIWYLVDHETRTCWITVAGTGHPRKTD